MAPRHCAHTVARVDINHTAFKIISNVHFPRLAFQRSPTPWPPVPFSLPLFIEAHRVPCPTMLCGYRIWPGAAVVVSALMLAATATGAALGGHSAASPAFQWSEWSSCSSPCGGGTQVREVWCLDRQRGTLLPSSSCANGTATPPTAGPCNTQQCPPYAYVYSEWSPCSHVCGAGTTTRAVRCVSTSDGSEAPPASCEGLPVADTQRNCNLQPCDMVRHAVGPWSACNATCGGSRNRTISCVLTPVDGRQHWDDMAPHQHDVIIPDEECARVLSLARPAEAEACGPPCDCACSGHGVCGPTRDCKCDRGFFGARCEQRACRDGRFHLVDRAGECCEGQLTMEGDCCPGSLDAQGRCCPADAPPDACGVCGGSGVFVDVAGVCCGGAADGLGLCCPPDTHVDACGVCGGAGTSCQLQLTVNLATTRNVSVFEEWAQFRSSITAAFAAAAGVSANTLTVFGAPTIVRVLPPLPPAVEEAELASGTAEVQTSTASGKKKLEGAAVNMAASLKA